MRALIDFTSLSENASIVAEIQIEIKAQISGRALQTHNI
jgi:hypothetical protein